MLFRNLIKLSYHIVLCLWNDGLLKLHEESLKIVGYDIRIFDAFKVRVVALADVCFQLSDFGVRASDSENSLREKSALVRPEVTNDQPKNCRNMIAAKLWPLSELLQMLPIYVICVDHLIYFAFMRLWSNSVS